jgi:hypothetical protein
MFAVSHAHLFGFGAAVVNFNRIPELVVAIIRRCFPAAVWHFFDDFGILAPAGDTKAQGILRAVLKALGYGASSAKSIEMCDECIHLGILNSLTDLARDTFTLAPKPGRPEKILRKISAALSAGIILHADLASLRGDLVFLTTTSFAKVARTAFGGLKIPEQKAYIVTGTLKFSLMLFQKIIIKMRPRLIKLVEYLQKIVLVYTDAAWEMDEATGEILATLGTLLMDGNETIARAAHAPREWIASLRPRKSQILACELIALAGLLLQDGEGLKDQHVLIFIDNLAGACLLTKGSTEQADIQ